MRRLEDLEVWRRAFDFAERVYRFAERYPAREAWRLTNQTCRAAISLPANIAEGWGRGTPGQFRYFLGVARGSAAELETHLLLAVRLGYATRAELQPLLNELHRIQRMIEGLMRTLRAPTRKTSGRMRPTKESRTRGPVPNAARESAQAADPDTPGTPSP